MEKIHFLVQAIIPVWRIIRGGRVLKFNERHLILALILVLILVAAVLRMIPHPYNVASTGALALFSGAYLRHWAYWLVPLGAQLLGDLYIGFYHPGVMVSVYLGFAVSAALGRWMLQDNDRTPRILLAVGGGALCFWLLSNFGHWLVFGTEGWQGIAQNYGDAIPFLARSLLGDALYAGLLFGAYKQLRKLVRPAPLAPLKTLLGGTPNRS